MDAWPKSLEKVRVPKRAPPKAPFSTTFSETFVGFASLKLGYLDARPVYLRKLMSEAFKLARRQK